MANPNPPSFASGSMAIKKKRYGDLEMLKKISTHACSTSPTSIALQSAITLYPLFLVGLQQGLVRTRSLNAFNRINQP